MTKLARVQVLPERRRVGRPKKILDLQKLDQVKVAIPESAERAIEDVLIFDARCLDVATRQELLRILPQLLHVRRAWKAEFLEYGCASCQSGRKPDPTYKIAAKLRRAGMAWSEIFKALTLDTELTPHDRKLIRKGVSYELRAKRTNRPRKARAGSYGAGGFCAACQGLVYRRMRNRFRKAMEGRNFPAELVTFTDALMLKFNAAQRLLNGGAE